MLKIFTYITNVEELAFIEIYITPIDFIVLDLQHLKNLSSFIAKKCYNFDFSKLKFKENVLQSFKITTEICKNSIGIDLNKFLEAQKNLKIFSIDERFYANFLFTKSYLEIINLEEFSFFGEYEAHHPSLPIIEKFVTQQKNLKILKLEYNISETILIKVFDHFRNLEHLSISFRDLDPKYFAQIENLKNLNTLELVETNLSLIFTKIFNIPINILKLFYCYVNGTKNISNFTKSFPNLKFLDIKSTVLLKTNFIFEKVFQNMQNLEDFKLQYANFNNIPFKFKVQPSNMNNQSLKSLTIHYPITFQWKFSENFPNLKNLDIFINYSKRKSLKKEMKKLFSKLKHLETIFITFVSEYCVDLDIFRLIYFNANLKVIQLSNISILASAVVEIRKEFSKIFEIVEIINGFEEIGLSILLAKNEEILIENKARFEKIFRIYCTKNGRYYQISSTNLYKKALKYLNVGEIAYEKYRI